MVIPTVDHDCELKDLVVELANKLAKVEHELALIKKAHVGPKTERSKMPRIDAGKKTTDEEKLAKVEHELALIKKAHVGPKTERSKMPRIDAGKKTTDEEKLAKRRERARLK